MPGLYHHRPHPHTLERLAHADEPASTEAIAAGRSNRLNAWLAVKITKVVGTMWCAYLFAAIAVISFPAALRSGTSVLISWIAQTFLQLVLLSIIIVGQNISAAASDKRADDTYKDAEAILTECLALQAHLAAQDDAHNQTDKAFHAHLSFQDDLFGPRPSSDG